MNYNGMQKIGNEMRRFDAHSPEGDVLIMVINLNHYDTPIGEVSSIHISLTEQATNKVVGTFSYDFTSKVNMPEAMELVSKAIEYSKA